MSSSNETPATTTNAQVAPELAAFFRALSQPARIEILLAIAGGSAGGEACVCHLEAVLGQRQAYISQHLMALRDADLITSRRDGRFVYYSLVKPELLALLQSAAEMNNLNATNLLTIPTPPRVTCSCPHCSPEAEAFILPEDI